MTDRKRRQLVTFMSASTVAIPLSALIGSLPSKADEVPIVDEASPGAKNWDYMAISNDAEKNCSNCALYQGDANSIVGPCPLFAHMNVSVNALCNAYSPTPS